MDQHKPKRPSPYFDYQPLEDGWIRLVAVKQATNANEIWEQLKIQLIPTPLNTCPPYTALSYTWGDASPNIDPCTTVFTKVLCCYPILCQNRIILASRNLRDALRRIRQYQTWRANGEETFEGCDEPEKKMLLERAYGGTTYFWIDALCINQGDVNERSRQVSLMGRIYSQASHTLIWLGESDEYTEAAESFLRKVALNVGVEVSTSRPNKRRPRYMGIKHLDTDEQMAFLAIMSRNWFFRMWVLQECVLSSRLGVLLGDLCFNFQLLLHAANVECAYGRDYSFAHIALATAKIYPNFSSSVLSENVFNSVQKLVLTGYCQEIVASGHLPDFLSVVAASRSLIATEPRDKLYGLLGIVSELQSDKLSIPAPDYTKKVENVFVEMTYAIMQARKDLAVLSLASAEVGIKTLPSWCPDYSSNGKALRTIGDTENAWLSESAWTHPPNFQLLPDMKLRVEGTRIDIVVESTGINSAPSHISEENHPSRLKFGIAEMCALALKLDLPNHDGGTPNHQSRVQILWRTLILDELQGVSPVSLEVGALFPEYVKWLLTAIINHHRNKKGSKEEERLSEVELHHYVEKLVSCSEALVALEPLDGTLLPDSAQLRALLKHSNVEQSTNSDGRASSPGFGNFNISPADDTAGSSASTPPLLSPRIQPSKASTRKELDETFVAAYSPLMFATMARLRQFTLALTQASVLPLDEVWILHGAHAPVVLRPTCHGQYQFLGDVYVHGIMHDEDPSIYGPLNSLILE